MSDYACKAVTIDASNISRDPISISGFSHGYELCKNEYIAAYSLATRVPERPPEENEDFNKAVISLATACWHHRVGHKLLIQAVADAIGPDTTLLPFRVRNHTGSQALRLSKLPWMRNEVSAKIESEILYLKMAMNGSQTQDEQDDEEIFRKAVTNFNHRLDLVYVMAMLNGYGEIAAQVLPGAVWAFRVYPLRHKIFSEMLSNRIGESNES